MHFTLCGMPGDQIDGPWPPATYLIAASANYIVYNPMMTHDLNPLIEALGGL